MSVRWDGQAGGASGRGWMEGSLLSLEAEMLPLVAMLMALFYPAEFKAIMETA